MPLYGEKDHTLDDVDVLGPWNFTLQGDTPLYWIRSGTLDRYHMRFHMHTKCPSTCGIVIHAEADLAGTDGVSFWTERRPSKEKDEKDTKRYILAGSGLDSRSIITRPFPDEGGDFSEEVEVLVQGYTGAVFLQGRKITLKFKMKQSRGSVAFYNSSSVKGGSDDVHFSDVRITALRRGPMEIGGTLGKREKAILALDERPDVDEAVENQNTLEPRTEGVSSAVALDVPVGGTAGAAVGSNAGSPQVASGTLQKPQGGDGHFESRTSCSTFAPSSAGRGTSGTFPSTSEAAVRARGGFGSPKATTSNGWGGGLATTDSRGIATPHRGGPSTPHRQRLSPPSGGGTPNRSWGGHKSVGGGGWGATKSPQSPAFIRKSSSDSTLRKTTGSMWGLPPASRTNGRWAPVKVNAPASEHELLHQHMKSRRDGTLRNTCADFIPMEH